MLHKAQGAGWSHQSQADRFLAQALPGNVHFNLFMDNQELLLCYMIVCMMMSVISMY